MREPTTVRGHEWADFAKDVLTHVENYTVPQYGDAPDDQASTWDVLEIKSQLSRYVNRIGRNARGEAESRRDCLKIAHYACILALRIDKNQKLLEGGPENA